MKNEIKELEKKADLEWFLNVHMKDALFFLLLAEKQMKFLTETARKLELDDTKYFKRYSKQINEISMVLERYCHNEDIFTKHHKNLFQQKAINELCKRYKNE